MRNKRGLSYADWLVSISTFLIAIVFIFVLIKPKLEPVVERENVMVILENGFFGKANWEVKEFPVFIKQLDDVFVNNVGSVVAARVSVVLSSVYNYQWGYAGFEYAGGSGLTTLPGMVAFLDGSSFWVECTAGICTDKVFRVKAFPLTNTTGEQTEVALTCFPSNSSICDATLGATLTKEGMNEANVQSIKATDYYLLKQDLHFPQGKDFAIVVNDEKITNNPEPPQRANIVVKEVKTWFVNAQGVLTPATVRFSIW